MNHRYKEATVHSQETARALNATQIAVFLLGLQETWNKLHHILPGQIDYLDVAGTVCALTVMYGRLLSRFAIQTARSEHA